MEVLCYCCGMQLDVVFSLNTDAGKPAFLSDRIFDKGFKIRLAHSKKIFEVDAILKHKWAGWIHYLKEIK